MAEAARTKLRVDMSTRRGDRHGRKQAQESGNRERQSDSQITDFRLPIPIAKAVKVEAARRRISLNALLVEMWELYRESKRAV